MAGLSNLSRRQALVGVGAIGAAVALPASLAATAVDRLAWDKAVNRLIAAERSTAEALEAYNAADTRVKALSPSTDGVSRMPMPWVFLDERDIEFAYDTGKARALITRCGEPDRSRYMAALDGIDRYRDQVKRVRDTVGMARHNDRLETAASALGSAENAMFQTAAPDAAALHFKLERMMGAKAREDNGDTEFSPKWPVEIVEPVMADVRRLLKGGAA